MSNAYRKPDGSMTSDKSFAHRVSPGDVRDAWRKVSARIPAKFAVGTAQHETNFTVNESTLGDQSDGTSSDGIFQISSAEKIKAGHPLADLFDLDDAATVFAVLMHRNLDAIQKLVPNATDSPDVWAYLAMAHNMGLGAVQKTIKEHGLDWTAYKARNPGIALVAHGYGDDVINGGAKWDPSWSLVPPPDASVTVSDPVKVAAVGGLVVAGLAGAAGFWAWLSFRK